MFRYLCALTTLLIALGGCASYPDVNRQRLENLPQHYSHYDAHLAWQLRGAGSEMIIEGEFKNARYSTMEDIEVWIAALDPAGKTIARSVGFVVPHEIRLEEIAPFTVKLPVSAVPGMKLRFTYKYVGKDGGSDGGGGGVGTWMQSFDAVVPAQ